nr:MAG TPA: hypothetical protein [Bacteriophage sp.]
MFFKKSVFVTGFLFLYNINIYVWCSIYYSIQLFIIYPIISILTK